MPVCGNRARHDKGVQVVHATVDLVRVCFLDKDVWDCTWLSWVTNPEDGERTTEECGGLTWNLPDGRGYACEHGHSHVYDEVRASERWDYAADEEEAGLLAGRGTRPVAMDGGPIDFDLGAFRYAAGLPG